MNKEKAEKIYNVLESMYLGAKCALHFTSAWELLVATILSAQCTDKRVNMVTPLLFKKYPTIKDFADCDLEKLQQDIHSTGFFRNKSKNIKRAAETVLRDFKGKVPQSMEELVTIPGIARKSANVLLFIWYGQNDGVIVDTHVKRLSNRLGFTKEQNPTKIEKDLIKLFPQENWGKLSYYLVDHGRAVCKAPTPKCAECKLKEICPSASRYL